MFRGVQGINVQEFRGSMFRGPMDLCSGVQRIFVQGFNGSMFRGSEDLCSAVLRGSGDKC